MEQLFDMSVGAISVIVKKKENKTFLYHCESRSYDGFIYVTAGTGLFQNQTGEMTLSENMLVLLERGEAYTVRALGDGFTYITSAYFLQPAGGCKKYGLPFLLNLDGHPYVGLQIEKMLHVWEAREPLYVPRTRVVLEQLLIDLFDLHSKMKNYFNASNKILPALNYISQYYDRAITVSQLAALCGMSVSHFRRVFAEKTGQSPMKYREKVRIYWAKQLLHSKLLTVTEVAEKLGYCDVYHFSKNFKQQTGSTPLSFLQKS